MPPVVFNLCKWYWYEHH